MTRRRVAIGAGVVAGAYAAAVAFEWWTAIRAAQWCAWLEDVIEAQEVADGVR